jgi:uncharacterized protein (TIGR03118 family)
MKTKLSSVYHVLLLVSASILVMAATGRQVVADGVNSFTQTNLVSDIPGVAAVTDPNLVNPWGISESPASPFWVSDNGSGLSTLYNTAGIPQGLVVSMPAGADAPTGQVFSATANFNGDLFIFATENGTINGWRGALGTNAEVLYPNTSGSVYKGLATGLTKGNQYLYAADFHNNQIKVFPGTGAPALSGNFTDPNLPLGFAPFNIENINGQLFVTYAKQDGTGHDDVAGAGNGFVDVFDLQGKFVKRLVSNGPLNSPWGMALAPNGFGGFGGALLVGNFGDGTINVFDPTTGTFIAQLDGTNGKPLTNLGLWGLQFGNGGNGGSSDALYFTAGIPGSGSIEDHGLFGSIVASPEPSSLLLVGVGMFALIGVSLKRIQG